MAMLTRQIEERGRATNTSGERGDLFARHDRITFRRDERAGRRDAAGIDAMQVARQREREKPLGAPRRGETRAVMREITLNLELGVVVGARHGTAVEARGEL